MNVWDGFSFTTVHVCLTLYKQKSYKVDSQFVRHEIFFRISRPYRLLEPHRNPIFMPVEKVQLKVKAFSSPENIIFTCTSLLQVKHGKRTLLKTKVLVLLWQSSMLKEVIHIISFEPISERMTSKSFHKPYLESVRIDMIGAFWRTVTREWLNLNGCSFWRNHLAGTSGISDKYETLEVSDIHYSQ